MNTAGGVPRLPCDLYSEIKKGINYEPKIMGVLACAWLPATNNTTDNLQNVLALTYMANSGGHQSIGFASPEQSLYVRCPVNP